MASKRFGPQKSQKKTDNVGVRNVKSEKSTFSMCARLHRLVVRIEISTLFRTISNIFPPKTVFTQDLRISRVGYETRAHTCTPGSSSGRLCRSTSSFVKFMSPQTYGRHNNGMLDHVPRP